ncbi:hypothetical protein V1264_014394 [Littorina saxatilis]|uniref:Peroxinectin n=1 Tax=Littorina saxatilis TaxID=31220 RepID=A0AAN9BSM2_9CAEN
MLVAGALKLTSLCPAKVNGRFTGQIAAKLEEANARVKRQGGGRRPHGGQKPPPPPNNNIAPPPAPENPAPAPPVTAAPAPTTAPGPVTEAPSECATASNVYRSADGSCNNLDNPAWGASLAPFRRLLPPAYQYVNGNNGPLLAPLTLSGAALPNVRQVSATVHTPGNRPDRSFPVMVMQWGQFLDHDVTARTPVETSGTACCSTNLTESGAAQHSDVSSGGPCFPILIGDNDRFFNTLDSRCLEFVRSLRTLPDGETEEQQVNLLTAYIDGSNEYGTSVEETNDLRGDDGLLLEGNEGQLPAGDDGTCNLSGDNDYCLKAGDSRPNVFPGLGALHTVFLRQHNKIARALKANHTDWNNETVFQETRKIVGALIQHITYTEYLPNIVGTAAMATYGLNSDSSESYDTEVDATLANVFSAAAFRFGHSSIPASLQVDGANVPIQNVFNDPNLVLNNLMGVVNGLLRAPAQEVDRWYTVGMTNHLFENGSRTGTDIVSLNIQRGRDHGLRPYNDWRDFCSLDRIEDFHQMGPDGNVFQRVYSTTNDIDLYSGALSERPVAGGSVGETYACLLGMQFRDLKNGDRFWYERTSSEGFTAAQLTEIKKMSLSGVLCDAFDDQLQIQPKAINLAVDDNARVGCGLISRMNLDAW